MEKISGGIFMFNNTGNDIKSLSKILCGIGSLGALICSFVWGDKTNSFFFGFLFFVLSVFAVCISSFILYGFGELIENTTMIHYNTHEIHTLLKKLVPEEDEKETKAEPPKRSYLSSFQSTTDSGWICKNCNAVNDKFALFCKNCGKYK